MASIQVVGEALIDLVNDQSHPGGSPLNVAVGLGRLEHEVLLQTSIGDDPHGQLIQRHLTDSRVQLGEGSITGQPTGTAAVVLDEHGHPSYDFKLNLDFDSVAGTGSDILHTGSIAAFSKAGSQKISELFDASPAHQLRSFDPNIRPALIDKRLKAIKRIEQFFGLSHVVKLSDEDALWLYPGWDTARVLEHILSFGAQLAVMTFGARGSEARTAYLEVSTSSLPVTVADTVGAGDAFMAGLLHAIAESSLRQAFTDGTALEEDELVQALHTARSTAALTVQQVGANPPRLSALNDFLASTAH